MKKPTKSIVELLVEHEINGNTKIAITTETVPVLKGGKANPMKDRVIKRMEGGQVMIFQNKKVNGYVAMIGRRLVAEGKDPSTFVLGPRQWGVRRENMPFVDHINKEGPQVYLEVIFLKPGKVTYYFDGELIPKSLVQGLDDKEEGEQGGLDNKVIIRSFNIRNIKEITIAKEHFDLADPFKNEPTN